MPEYFIVLCIKQFRYQFLYPNIDFFKKESKPVVF